MTPLRDRLGICQWFHFEDRAEVERSVELLHELGVRHLRTGISWADFHRPAGQAWYDWQMRQLAGFDVLLSVWHTPPSLAEGEVCNGPPRRLRDYADFIGQVHEEYGEFFNTLELWNEPNNWMKWDFKQFDPQWEKFGQMIADAARQAKSDGERTVLGGMIPVDPHWLKLMQGYGVLEEIDIVAIHAFPQMWWPNHPNWDWHDHWHGWPQKIESIGEIAEDRPIWVTESGLATWDLDEGCEALMDLQVRMLERAAVAPAERLYWYSLVDLDPSREAIEGFHVDENEYHMGLVRWDGSKKDAFFRLQELLANNRAAIAPPSKSSG